MQILSNTLYANRTLLYLFEYLIKIEIFLVSSICSIKLPLFFVCPLLRICNVINLKKKDSDKPGKSETKNRNL